MFSQLSLVSEIFANVGELLPLAPGWYDHMLLNQSGPDFSEHPQPREGVNQSFVFGKNITLTHCFDCKSLLERNITLV